ncbi:MAG: GCN5-related N-acetyltransferase [Berkelbacteria bacterium GW2011_GWB1_38_5]|uniref:GCN5-related N-acetyltransferase n=2 Tax=Candidatus Berkelbacteria TaxID=1618330 RepID=A0A0G0LRA4_9BACT|nr:MAG: GCN5-related N-acetyltransferase [Berkelbacteria bacterium GW2011_GWB1_38_5]KKQ90525.1 MAG: GCN5-related N-acetyltransferase [Berkelbacteria bacterium GW2011_GWA1_39_10]
MFSNKPLMKFMSKSGKEIEIYEPSLDRLDQILKFVNDLSKEDTFLSFIPEKPITKIEEELWLKSVLNNIKYKKAYVIWAICNDKIVGSCDVYQGGTARDKHVGKIGIMVDKNFRREGIGSFLLNLIIEHAKNMEMNIVSLTVFSDNNPAISFYKKVGFKEWGRLPNGLFRKNRFSDSVKMYKEL